MQVNRSSNSRNCSHCHENIYEQDTLESGRSVICVVCSNIYHKNCAEPHSTELKNVFECCVQDDLDLIGYEIAENPLKSDIEIVKSDLAKIYNINLNAISVKRFKVHPPRCKYRPLTIHFSSNHDLELVHRFKERLNICVGKVRINKKFDKNAEYLKYKHILDNVFPGFGPKVFDVIPKMPPLMSFKTQYPNKCEFNFVAREIAD